MTLACTYPLALPLVSDSNASSLSSLAFRNMACPIAFEASSVLAAEVSSPIMPEATEPTPSKKCKRGPKGPKAKDAAGVRDGPSASSGGAAGPRASDLMLSQGASGPCTAPATGPDALCGAHLPSFAGQADRSDLKEGVPVPLESADPITTREAPSGAVAPTGRSSEDSGCTGEAAQKMRKRAAPRTRNSGGAAAKRTKADSGVVDSSKAVASLQEEVHGELSVRTTPVMNKKGLRDALKTSHAGMQISPEFLQAIEIKWRASLGAAAERALAAGRRTLRGSDA